MNSLPTFLPHLVLGCLTLLLMVPSTKSAEPLVDDRAATLDSRREVEQRRSALIRYLWGTAGFPRTRLPDVVRTAIAPPARGPMNCG